MLAVVEDHERDLLSQVVDDLFDGVAHPQGEPDRSGDRLGDLGIADHCGQVDEPHTSRTMRELQLSDGEREPGLARAPDRVERHQAGGGQQPTDRGHVVFPPDEAGGPGRQVGQSRVEHAQRREVAVTDLEQRHRFGHVPEPVHSEIERIDTGDRSHLLGEQDLAAVTGRLHPRGRVHDCAEVVAAALLGFSDVDSHPHLQRRPGPLRRGQRRLCVGGRSHRVGGASECGREGIARGREHVPSRRDDGAAQDLVVELQRARHGRLVGRPQSCRTLDIAEQEGHRARRARTVDSHLTPRGTVRAVAHRIVERTGDGARATVRSPVPRAGRRDPCRSASSTRRTAGSCRSRSGLRSRPGCDAANPPEPGAGTRVGGG